MKALVRISLIATVALALVSAEVAAQGRGRGRGGQQGMRGRSAVGGANVSCKRPVRSLVYTY